jgi:type II secretory pathway component PulM
MGDVMASSRLPAMRAAWARQAPRDQVLLGLAGAAVALGAAWLLLQPLDLDSVRAQRDLTRDRALLATARTQADDITSLARGQPGAPAPEPRQALERALGELGLRGAVTSLDVADGRLRLTFAAVRFDALLALLDTLARSGGMRPVEMTLTPRVEPGTVRAELALSR